MTNVATLTAKLTADTSGLKKGLGSADQQVKGLGKSTSGMFAKMGPMAAAAGVAVAGATVAMVGKSVTAFADFDRSMKEVYTLMPGISQDAMKAMEGDVKDFSKEFGKLPEEVVPALYQAISAGVPPDNVFDFMETATKASIAGVTDMETSVDGITSAVNAYGSDVLSATEASDLMFTAVKLGKTDFTQLSKSMFQVAPVASGLGINFGDITAALAALTAQGTPTRVAATQMKGALAELGKEGSVAFGNFEDATGQTFPAFIESGGNLQEAFAAMKLHADDLGTGVQNMFGSIEAGQGALALTSESGGPAFVKAMEEMQTSAGATDTAFQTMDQGLSATWDKIKANVSVAVLDIGEKFAPLIEEWSIAFLETLPGAIDFLIGAVGGIVDVVSDFVRGVQVIFDWFKKLPGPIKAVTVVLGGVATALAVLYANPVIAGLAIVAGAVAFIGGNARDAEQQVADLETALTDLGESGDQTISDNVTAQVKELAELTPEAVDALNDMGLSFKDVERAIKRGDKSLGEWLREVLRTEKPMKGNITDVKELEKAFGPLEEAYANVADEAAASMEETRREMLETVYATDQAVTDSLGYFDQYASGMDDDLANARGSLGEFTTGVGDATSDIGSTLDESKIDWLAWEEQLGLTMEDTREQFMETSEGIVNIWDGAADKLEITADEMMENLKESFEQKQEFDRLFKELGDAGMFGLQQALLDGGPGAVDAIEQIASDQSLAYEAELYLNPGPSLAEMRATGVYESAQAGWAMGDAAARNFMSGFGTISISAPVYGGGAAAITPSWKNPGEIAVSAAGGIATGPTLSWVGEGGEPEAIIPLSRAGEFGFGGGSGDINVYVEGNLFGAADTDELVEILEDARRRMRLRGGAMI